MLRQWENWGRLVLLENGASSELGLIQDGVIRFLIMENGRLLAKKFIWGMK